MHFVVRVDASPHELPSVVCKPKAWKSVTWAAFAVRGYDVFGVGIFVCYAIVDAWLSCRFWR